MCQTLKPAPVPHAHDGTNMDAFFPPCPGESGSIVSPVRVWNQRTLHVTSGRKSGRLFICQLVHSKNIYVSQRVFFCSGEPSRHDTPRVPTWTRSASTSRRSLAIVQSVEHSCLRSCFHCFICLSVFQVRVCCCRTVRLPVTFRTRRIVGRCEMHRMVLE